MKRCYCFIFLLILFKSLSAQELNFDSYPAFYQTEDVSFLDSISESNIKAKGDSIRAVAFFVKGFIRMRDTTALSYFDSSYQISKQLDDNYLLSLNLYWKGNWYARRGKFDSCLFNTSRANDLLTDINRSSKRYLKFSILHQLANASFDLVNYKDALSYALDALRLAKASDNANTLVRVHMILGSIYGELSDPSNDLGSVSQLRKYDSLALHHLKKAYSYSRKTQNEKRITICALNVAVYYSMHFQIDSSNYYLDRALDSAPKEDALSRARIYDLYSENEIDRGNNESGLIYAKNALGFAKEVGRPRMIVKTYSMVAYAYSILKNYQLAELYFDSARILNESSLYDLNRAQIIQKGLFELYSDMGDYKKSLEAYISYSDLLDSMQHRENLAKVEDLQLKYETEKKDNEIKNLTQEKAIQELELERKNLYLAITGIGLILIIVFGFLIYRQRKFKEQVKVDELNIRLLRTQLNPHFLFNALNAIQQKILSESNKQQASDYLAKFSHMTREILEQNNEEYITLEEEIALLEKYIDLQKLRSNHEIEVTFDIDENLDVDRVKIPPMLAQPIVENAFEHGLLPKNADGKLNVSMRQKGQKLLISVEDNGVGYGEGKSDHQSMSGSITKDRLSLLEKKTNQKCSIDISSKKGEMDTFTKVTLIIPIL